MATVSPVWCVTQVGETAGVIWRLLDACGPMSISRLVKETDAPRDLVMQALGWLAREEKIDFEGESRTRLVTLRPF